MWSAPGALAAGSDPRPIDGGFIGGPGLTFAHVYLADGMNEQNTITDFDGVLAVAHHTGSGMAAHRGAQVAMGFDTDLRFMDGTYVAMDGVTRRGTFGFV
jgi:hypothetical protein